MGITTWRRPLPRTASPEERAADLAALRREIRTNALIGFVTFIGGGAALLATAVIMMVWY